MPSQCLFDELHARCAAPALDATPAAFALRSNAGIERLMSADLTLVQCYGASRQCTTRLLPARLAAYIALSASRSRSMAFVASPGASA